MLTEEQIELSIPEHHQARFFQFTTQAEDGGGIRQHRSPECKKIEKTNSDQESDTPWSDRRVKYFQRFYADFVEWSVGVLSALMHVTN